MSIFGMKWTIVICQFGYLAFIAANLYAKPALMYPASVLSVLLVHHYGHLKVLM